MRPGSSPDTRHAEPQVAIAHDYLTQRGGAERVVLSMARTFPGAPVHTSFYEADGTYPEFGDVDIHTAPIDKVKPLREHHRIALPLLAPTFSNLKVDADVVVCSTSGWAHGVRTEGRKLAFCHAPARWLYQRKVYTAHSSTPTKLAVAALAGPLKWWDGRACQAVDLYVSNSRRTRQMVRDAYGLDTEILHAPHSIDVDGPQTAVEGIEPGFFVCVARLMPYKNIDIAISAIAEMPGERLVIVGRGPDEERLKALAGNRVTFLPDLDDAQLRWLYANAEALMAFTVVEDFGLTPVEAAAFGTPSIVPPLGGYLDTVIDGLNGVHVDDTSPSGVAKAVDRLRQLHLEPAVIQQYAEPFSEATFAERLRGYVADLAAS